MFAVFVWGLRCLQCLGSSYSECAVFAVGLGSSDSECAVFAVFEVFA